jgi:hypothetical protein
MESESGGVIGREHRPAALLSGGLMGGQWVRLPFGEASQDAPGGPVLRRCRESE